MSFHEVENLTEFLDEVKLKMLNITGSSNKNIIEISDYVLANPGKFIRTQLVFIYGSVIDIEKKKLIELAAAAELIHLSTLIHDDIIDEAKIRRNKPTVIAKWGLKKAILYGDFLYTKTFQALNSLENTQIAEVLISCAEQLIEGEFIQLQNISDKNKEDYFKVIEKKTAILFSGILECLGIHGKLVKEKISSLKKLGLNFGNAFQLNDDLADFFDQLNSGKEKFKDLNEGKITYPIIITMSRADKDSRNNISKLIEEKKFDAVFDEIEKNDGFNLTRLERDKAINNCIEYTKTLFKLDNVELMESFLKNSLKA
ncbi:polyprenyl synthetase family protein [SAR86 cluster bacterium]|uniref:Polyprenyl synthetase family protein n=1 Tax=SAR86 cluster bacterium TaxID=2030880 RepID=A0A9Q8X171_9GAMM|nr:polyprenyl synthetase family protein [SAR86 cluster bacterium]